MNFIDVIFTVVVRLGLFLITSFFAVSLGLLDYILLKAGLSTGISSDLGPAWVITQILIYVAWAMTVGLLTVGAIGVFIWGIGTAFEL